MAGDSRHTIKVNPVRAAEGRALCDVNLVTLISAGWQIEQWDMNLPATSYRMRLL